MEVGMLLLRVTVGLTLAAHGAQKLFGWFGGHGLEATGQGLEGLGFHPGRRQALLAGLVETGSGVLLALGLGTPFAAAGVAAVMLVAAVSAHVPRGFFIMGGGYEYNLVLGIAALSVAFTGPGAISLDAAIGWPLSGATWGGAALALALAGGAVALALRQRAPVGRAEHAA